MRDLLLKLCTIPAVSGREEKLTEFILSEIEGFCDARVDRNGNIICFKKGKKSAVKKVVLDAHTDEVGIIATSVTSDGFVKFATVGGIEEAVMLCRSVTFENGVRGVIGMKPVHLSSADERKKYPDKVSLYKDIGAASKEQVSLMIQKTLKVELDPKYLDATDALAIALCHHYQMSNPLAGVGGKSDWKKFLENNPDRIKK